MSKSGTKQHQNVYREARLKASERNDRLRSRESTSEETGIDRTRIARIELGVLNPYPEEVAVMAETYNAPELRNWYCHNTCPLGRDVCEIDGESIDRISLAALASFRKISEAGELILDIMADGNIDESEKSDLDEIIRALERISDIKEEMKCWREKHFGKEE